MVLELFTVSLTMSLVIVLLLFVSPFLHKRYGARWCYLAWLVLAFRLLIPWRFELPDALLTIPAPANPAIMFIQDGKPGLILGGSYPEKSSLPADPAGNPAEAVVSGLTPVSEPASASVPGAGFNSGSAGHTSLITLKELLFGIWAMGALSFFLFHILSYLSFRRKIKPYCRTADETKFKGRPRLFRCPKIAGPMLTGFFRPVILLPELDYTEEELSVILKHELTHYRRGDIWYKLLLLAANSLHWFNPLIYLMRKAANRDLEYSCDDLVVKDGGLDLRKQYSLAILKSMQNDRVPVLTTALTESGDQAKRRFVNILDSKNKKRGLWAMVLVLLLAGTGSTLVACSSGQSSPVHLNDRESTVKEQENTPAQPDSYAELLYSYKGTDTGDNSKVGAIIHALGYTDLQIKSFELKTDSEPYDITVDYLVDSRSNYRFYEAIETAWNKNAAVMLSLIPNAGKISFRLYDPYGDFAGSYYSRENLSERPGMDYFAAGTVNAAVDSLGSFSNYLNQVLAIKNRADYYGELQKQNMERDKQIYTVIGDDREITVNSGMLFPVAMTDDFAAEPPLKELSEQKNILAQYIGQKLDFLIYDIHNFKTNDYTFYLFVFDGEKMIAHVDIKTDAAEQNAVKILSALQ